MRPAHKSISAGVGSSRAGLFHTSKPLFKEHPNLVLRPLPYRRSPSDSQLLFSFPKGKGISLCQRNFMLETWLSKPPPRISSSCLVKLERFNLLVSWKTAIPDAREALLSSKCPARKKPHQRSRNSMVRKSVAAL